MMSGRLHPNRVRELRLQHDLTQRELAKKARIGTRTIGHIESGKSCKPTTKRKILKALRIPISKMNEVFTNNEL
jgi:DNA-binding XRE family transcriptional regulator